MIKIFTIGVYNSTEDSFFKKLIDNNIDLFCDIRLRRGVRGAQYKYVNSNYLQSKLQQLGISYRYIKELAPTNDIRQKQKEADKLNGESKKERRVLGSVFKSEYLRCILNEFDINALADELVKCEAQNIVFFCVEEYASACHRSLVAERLSSVLNCEIINL